MKKNVRGETFCKKGLPGISSQAPVFNTRMLPAVFFISFAAIGWQLALMRCLLISTYHHFCFLIISCALLGFGIGGTLLSLFRSRFEEKPDPIFRWGTVAFALSMPVCFRLGELLPLSVYFPPVNVIPVLGWWLLFWGIHGIPFVLAGILIGLALMMGGKSVNRVYACNLVGGAAGALGAMVLLQWLPATGLAVPFALSVLASGFFLGTWQERRFGRLYLAALIIAASALVTILLAGTGKVFPLNIDEYKPLAYVERLAKQGSAHRAITLHGPRGRVDLFTGPHFHTLLSLSSSHPPPPMDALLRDGFQIGSILSISDLKEAGFLEGTLSALPYKLIAPKTVLILGDSSGIYVWLARLSPAASIVLVQPDPNLLRVLESHPSRVLRDPRVRVVVTEPRAFLDSSSETFDIIHLAALEGFAAGSGGIGGLREDYLATVEGFRKCLHALTPAGMALVIRGVQEPERDNLKIAATWIEAMERQNIADPGACIMVVRDELSAAILAGGSPFSTELVERFKQTCRDMSWDPEWFPGVREEDTNRVHVLPGPAGSRTSWYHRAMEELLSTGREDFYRNWVCNIRPATDDRPFFHDFFRWASVSRLREVFGPLWPTRSEMGFLLLVMAALWTALTALVLLPAPVFLLSRGKRAVPISTIGWTAIYFSVLGTGFMFLEMSFIQIFTRFLGDPVAAAALVLGGFLLFAGAGSMVQPRVTQSLRGGLCTVAFVVAAITLGDSMLFPRVFEVAAGLSIWWKIGVGTTIIAPLAFFMGMPFPWGLSRLYGRHAEAVPLAWAVNGFASVVSASAAVILAMTYGFRTLSILAAGMYVTAGLLSSLAAENVKSENLSAQVGYGE